MAWTVDREATVAKNVRCLREGRGITQQQLGADLLAHGFGMSESVVAKLEAGAKPLRLNEIAAIAAYFEVPLESLWEGDGELVDKLVAARLAARETERAEQLAAEYYAEQRAERLRDKCSPRAAQPIARITLSTRQ